MEKWLIFSSLILFTWAVYVKFSGLVLLVQKNHPNDDVIN
jgi:hypothetical protein